MSLCMNSRNAEGTGQEEWTLICVLDLGFSFYRPPHNVAVIDFDDVGQVIITYDGVQAKKIITYERYLREWSRAGNWMLVSHPEKTNNLSMQ